jgi:hypothetical protein
MNHLVHKASNSHSMIFFMKFEPSNIEDIIKIIQPEKGNSFISGDNNVYCEKILYVLGKYDLALIIHGNDFGGIARFCYNTIAHIEYCFPNSVLDYYKIPFFKWDIEDLNKIKSGVTKKTIAFIQIKLKDPIHIFPLKERSILDVISEFTNFELSLFCGLSWHEILIDFHGDSLRELNGFVECLLDCEEISSRIAELSTILMWEPNGEYEVSFESYLNVILKINDYRIYKLPRDENAQYRAFFGFTDIINIHKVTSFDQIRNVLLSYELKQDNLGLKKFSSALSFDKKINYYDSFQANKSKIVRATNKLKFERITYSDQPNRINIVAEKVNALYYKIKMLKNEKRFSYLIPDELITTLDLLLKLPQDFDESDVEGYIIMVEYAIQQRLWGIYPLSEIGLITSYADGYGGFQRILLACETLLYRSLEMMNIGIKKLPPILIFFDQTGLHELDFSIYESIQKHYDKAPIVVRIPGFKYQPWFWHKGIWVIAEWAAELSQQIMIKMRPFIKTDTASLSIMGYYAKVFRYNILKRIRLLEFDDETVREDKTKILLNLDQYRTIRDELINLKNPFMEIDYDEKVEVIFKNKLMRGEVILHELKEIERFREFTNAYFGIEMERRSEPRIVNAFLFSLYFARQYIYES